MPKVSAQVGSTVHLRLRAVGLLESYYRGIDSDAPWKVVQIDGGYGREALWLQDAGGRMIMVWRGQCTPLPRCEYCGVEGHSNSKGTGKTCAVRAEEVKASRAAVSARMKAAWAAKKAGLPPPLAEESPEPLRGAFVELAEESPF